MTRTARLGIYILQLSLMIFSIASALIFAVWLLGANGFGVLSPVRLPESLALSDIYAAPNEAVSVGGEEVGIATAIAAQEAIGGSPSNFSGAAPSGTSEFFSNTASLSFLAVTAPQSIAWTTVRALPLAGMSVIFGLMFLLIRAVRQGQALTPKVARYLGAIGVIAAVGSPLLQWARWVVADWLVETSTAAQIAEAAPLKISLWPIILGLLIVMIGFAWREAILVKADTEGLV